MLEYSGLYNSFTSYLSIRYSNFSFRYPTAMVMSRIPASWSWRIWRSIMRSPNTSKSPLGVSNVRGTKREPNPAAMISAPSTLYGSSSFRPSSSIFHFPETLSGPSSAISPRPTHSFTRELTVPRDTSSFCAISRCVISGCSSTALHISPYRSIRLSPHFCSIYLIFQNI